MDELTELYKRKIIVYENKDDEYAGRVQGYYDKYSSMKESIVHLRDRKNTKEVTIE